MKIRIATMLWAFTTVCLFVGWMWERNFYQRKFHKQLDEEVKVECAITSALRRNTFASSVRDLNSGVSTTDQFDAFEKRQLVDSVIELYLREPLAREDILQLENGTFRASQFERILESAGVTLGLLEIDNARGMNAYFSNNKDFFEFFGSELFSNNQEISPEFSEFVERATMFHAAATVDVK